VGERLRPVAVVGPEPARVGAGGVERSGQVTETARLTGAPLAQGGRIEEQHDRSLDQELAEPPGRALVVRKFEILYGVAHVHAVASIGVRVSCSRHSVT